MNTHVHEKIKDFMNHGLNDHVCRKMIQMSSEKVLKEGLKGII